MRGQPGLLALRILAAALAAAAFLAFTGTGSAATLSARNAREPNLVERINAVRADHGLAPLRSNYLLNTAATRHAKSMGKRGYFRHELRKEGSWFGFGTWIHWYWPGPGYTSWTAGENLAWGAPDLSAGDAVTMWMNSPGHRANLLGSWKRVGVAIVHVDDPSGYYGDYRDVTLVAAEFGKRSG